jgi:hypothetical protein
MSDWIQKLRTSEDLNREKQSEEHRLRLHKSRMIDAKLPEFWATVVQSTEAQALELMRVFPEREEYQTEFTITENGGFVLRQIHGKQAELSAWLDTKGQAITTERRSRSQDKAFRENFRGQVTVQDYVYVVGTKSYSKPESLAESFVKHVCSIY